LGALAGTMARTTQESALLSRIASHITLQLVSILLYYTLRWPAKTTGPSKKLGVRKKVGVRKKLGVSKKWMPWSI